MSFNFVFLFVEFPSEVPKLPEITMTHDTSSKFEESEDTLKSGMETSVEMDNSTDVEMADS